VALNPRDGTFEKVAIRDSQDGLITQLAHCQANGRLYLLFKTHDGKDDLPSTADIEVLDYRKGRYERRPFSKPLGNPRGICVSQKSGNFVVCDLIQRRVAVFSPQDRMVASIGAGQDIELNLRIPSRTAIDRDENLLICDQSLGMIHKIDLAKKRVIWNVRFPGVSVKGIAVDDENNAYFTSQFSNRIYKLDNNGHSIYESNIPTEQSNGVFFYDGNIYVYDCMKKEIFNYSV